MIEITSFKKYERKHSLDPNYIIGISYTSGDRTIEGKLEIRTNAQFYYHDWLDTKDPNNRFHACDSNYGAVNGNLIINIESDSIAIRSNMKGIKRDFIGLIKREKELKTDKS